VDIIRFGAVLSAGTEWEPFLEARNARASGGSALVEFDGPPVGYFWHVERITIDADADGEVAFYISQVNRMLLVEFSYMIPNVADEASAIYVPEGQPLIAEFLAQADGSLCIVHIQGRRYQSERRQEWDSRVLPEEEAP